MDEATIAELSRLRAFAARVGPIVKAAVELRELGRSLERAEEIMDARRDGQTRCMTPWLILQQGYETALKEFDERVKAAALGNFEDLLNGSYGSTIAPAADLPVRNARPRE